MNKKISLAVILILSVILTACNINYRPSQQLQVTPSPTSREFTNPLDSEEPMSIVEDFATGTAAALTAAAGGGPTSTETPIGGTPLTPDNQITFTPTPIIPGGVTLTPSLTPVVPGGNTLTPSPISTGPTSAGTRPATYTLQSGEFPYCIARRFNVDPDDLLALNGLTRGDIYMPGLVLQIPQTGSFPGERALMPHPATYTVTGNNDTTFYAIACKYGDIGPGRIAQANNLPVSAELTVGQKINIP